MIKVQVCYIENDLTDLKQVGFKEFKGLNTDNIEIHISAYDPEISDMKSFIWVLLTDCSIKDFK